MILMSFKQFLEEGRDAPLYHVTPLDNFFDIAMSNRLNASNLWTYGAKPTVSFTRNYKFCFEFARQHLDTGTGQLRDTKDIAILEIDQRRLSQRYKIIPYRDLINLGDGSRLHYNEFEEYIQGDVKNVSDYIIKTHIPAREYWHSNDVALSYKKKYRRFISLVMDFKPWDTKSRKFIDAI
jgi:hypothetical protein